jgi:hypothetical protein
MRWIFFESFGQNSFSCVFFPLFFVGAGEKFLTNPSLGAGGWRCILRPLMSAATGLPVIRDVLIVRLIADIQVPKDK